MQVLKNATEDKTKNLKLKRNSEFSKTNRIRLELFSFEKNEINERQKNDSFSFTTMKVEEKKEPKGVEEEKVKSKFINKHISLDSKKTSDDSLDSSDIEDESSDMSCCEEEEI